MKKLRRIAAIALCVTTLLSTYVGVGFGAISASAATVDSTADEIASNENIIVADSDNGISTIASGTTVTIYHCYDTNGNSIKAVKSVMTHVKGEIQDRFVVKSTGQNAYCIQPGTHLSQSSVYTAKASSVYTGLSDAQREAINAALCFGWEGNSSAIKSGTTINSDQGYVATQLIIWEFVTGERNATAPYSLKSGKSGYLSMYCAGGASPNIKTAYNRIVKAMSTFWKIPNFTKLNDSSASTITLDAVYNETTKKWTYSSKTLNDSNKV